MFKQLLLGAAISVTSLAANSQTARQYRSAPPLLSIKDEAAPLLIVDPPLAGPLETGKVVVEYFVKNMRILPVYGEPTTKVSPRIGHLHVTVDDASWHWADASNEAIIIVGMKQGKHKILIELADPTHKVLQSKTVEFVVPQSSSHGESHH